jgi:hypothetical protein
VRACECASVRERLSERAGEYATSTVGGVSGDRGAGEWLG